MIETLIFTLGCAAGLIFGLLIGKRRAIKYQAVPPQNNTAITLQALNRPLLRFSNCIDVRISDDMDAEERISRTTSAVVDLCSELVRELLYRGVVRPVYIDGDIRPFRNIRRLYTSILAAQDPAIDGYPDAEYHHDHPALRPRDY